MMTVLAMTELLIQPISNKVSNSGMPTITIELSNNHVINRTAILSIKIITTPIKNITSINIK